jgi:RNA polymerase sigma factor (sigma-70 family)
VTSDLELLEAWRGGDREAGGALFDRYFDVLARFFANKLGDGLDDLVQQTFLAAVEGRDRYRGDAPFRNYLLRIGHNILCKHYRQQRVRNVEPDLSVSAIVDLDPSPSSIAVRRGEQVLLLQALRAIPFDCQVVLELAFWEHASLSEVAEILEIPVGTAKSRMRRAKQLLRERIEQLASSPAELERTSSDLAGWAAALRGLDDDDAEARRDEPA